MGIEPFLLASSIVGIIAQRLIRKLCIHCKCKRQITTLEQGILNTTNIDLEIHYAVGCEHCNHTGYTGRTGIYELIPIDETLRAMIYRNESIQKIEEHIRPNIPSIRTDGFRHVMLGETSIAEVLHVTSTIAI